MQRYTLHCHQRRAGVYQEAWLPGSVVVDSGPALVAGPFTHNSTLCDSALKYAQGLQVLLGLPLVCR